MITTRRCLRAGVATLLLTGLAATGCQRLQMKSTRLTFDQFVNATVALRRAAAEVNDTTAFQLRKREIEKKLNFSDADLREFSRVHATDVVLISAAWDSVEARLDRPDSAAKGAPPGAAAPQNGRTTVVPGALPGGLPAVVRNDSLTPPPGDTIKGPPNDGRAIVHKPKPFY